MAPLRRNALPSIRSKLFLLVLASVLPILLAYIAFVHDAGRREAEHVARDAATVTRALAAALERELGAAETAARVVAASPALAPDTLARFHAEASRLLRPEFAVSNFALSDAGGRLLLDTRHAFGGTLPAQPPRPSVATVLRSGDARISSVYRPEPGQAYVFSADVPVWREGKVAWVLSSEMRPRRIAELLAAQQLPEGWVAEVIDGRGQVVARSSDGALQVGSPVNGVLASSAAAKAEGLVALPDEGDGRPSHVAWTRSPRHGWLVALTYPDDAARELLGASLPATVAASAALLGLGLLLAWTIGGTIARSVQGLVEPAAALGRGAPLAAPPRAIRETAVVADALREVEAELLQYRSQLEARVADRTAELERLNVRLETVYATAPVGLCFVDPSLRFVMINDYLAGVNAVPAMAHLGRTLPELLGEQGVVLEAPYRRVLDTGRALLDLEMAAEARAEPGVMRYWLSSYYPVFGPQRELVGINAVLIDITERKRLEWRNRDNEELFRVLFEASGDAQALLAYNAHFVSVNAAAARMFGYSAEELTSRSPASVSPEFQPNGRRSEDYASELMRRALDEGGVQFEWVHQRRDGGSFHADVRLTSVDIGGRGMMQVTIRDISARVAADAALRASSAQLRQRNRFIRTVTDHLPAVVSYWDADEKLRFANRPALAWLGVEDDAEVIGRSTAELVPPEVMARLGGHVRAVLAGHPQNFETELRNRNGEQVHVWGSYLPDVGKDGRVRGFYALHADVSALKLTEGRLVEALREAQQASRAKSKFLGNMSHEIRTPMNAIVGLARLLEEAPLGQRERTHAAHIRQAASSLLGILNDLLDYARTDAGQLELEHRPFPLDTTLQALALLSAADAWAKGVETVFAVAPEVPRLLRGDPARLEQVLLNLAGNAVKFTEGGQIVLSVDLAARSPGRVRLRFAVSDTGIGIARADQARVFEPFAQVGGGEGREGSRASGVGLGLSIAHRLVALMGGSLALESVPGQGTRVSFEADFGEIDAPATPPEGPPRRMLVVDDNASAAAALAGSLRAAGHEVACAPDCAAAAALLQRERFDLAFADAPLPGLPALEGLPPTVLMAAGADAHADGAAPVLAGAPRVVLLGKPFTRGTLEAAIAQLLGGALQAAARSPLAASLAGLRVLVVEDNALNQQVATHLLQHAGAVVALAGDGRAALDVLREDAAFDAVLMDLQMPVMNGYQATEAIRAMGLHGLPVIAMSANTLDEDRRRAFEAGMDDHLAKPIDADELVRTLARLAGRSSPEPAHEPAHEPTQAAVPAGLPALPGVDLQAALPRFGGKLAAFGAVFGRFAGGLESELAALRAAIEDGRQEDALALAHRLRGVAANLGAVDLVRHALALEAALRAGAAAKAARAADAVSAMHGAMAPLQAAARALETAESPAAAPGADAAALAALLDLLRNNNMKALAAHGALAPALQARLGTERAAELAEAVGTLRFEHAAGLVRAILEPMQDR